MMEKNLGLLANLRFNNRMQCQREKLFSSNTSANKSCTCKAKVKYHATHAAKHSYTAEKVTV